MFATMRRTRRSATMKDELGQSVDHFKRAAALAAQETSATVGPKFSAARERVQPVAGKAKDAASSSWDSAVATLTPLVSAAGDNLRQAGKMSRKQVEENSKAARKSAKAAEKSAKKAEKAAKKRKARGRGSRLLGYALVGTAVGVGAASFLRKRKAAQWDEYDPAAPITSSPAQSQVGGAGTTTLETTDTVVYAEPDIVVEDVDVTGTGTTTGTTGTATTASTGGTGAGATAAEDLTTPDLAADDVTMTGTTDQTSSAQHSPTVARMAGGKNKD